MSNWSVIVAAAGRGTRLGFDKPKILFPVGGRTILNRLVQLFEPLVGEFIFVLSPEGETVVGPLLPTNSRIAVQSAPKGMGDAVNVGAALVRTEYTAVVWGDQFGLRRASLEHCMTLLESTFSAEAVCPTLLRSQPYIHFDRERGTLAQRREGDAMPDRGESDSGVFFFRTAALRRWLPVLLESPACTGRKTDELNFLPVFPLIDRQPGALLMPRIMNEAECEGVNTREDAARFEAREATFRA